MSSIGPVVSEEKMFENVDGRRSHWYTISSPMSRAFGSGELKGLTLQTGETMDQLAMQSG